MATVSAGALLSAIPLSLDSLHSPKFASRSLSNWCLKPLPPTFATNFSFKSRNIAFNESRFLVKATAEDLSADVGEVLGDVSIFTRAGEPVLFKDLWDQTQGVAVVALLRHFGCPFCWELALALKEAIATFDLAGVKLIAVGVGSPNKAQILAERCKELIDFLLMLFFSGYLFQWIAFMLTPTTREVYNLLGLSYGISRTFFNPAKVLTRFGPLQKAVENYTIKGTLDDMRGIFQQEGMFVFRGKDLLYAWRDEGSGDHAPLDDILSICCKVPAS